MNKEKVKRSLVDLLYTFTHTAHQVLPLILHFLFHYLVPKVQTNLAEHTYIHACSIYNNITMLIEILTILATMYVKLFAKKFRISKCLLGKTAIVTGGNEGIGYEICVSLAARGCRVIIADKNDAEESARKIAAETGNPNVIYKKIDLASLTSVRVFAKSFSKEIGKLDILVNNAGLSRTTEFDNVTEDGLHPVMQINFFGHFLLTNLLLDLLKASESGRVLFANSCLCFCEDLDLANINADTYQIYPNSKLALLIASDHFAETLNGTGITSNSYHPGMVLTRIYEKLFDRKRYGFRMWLTVWSIKIMNPFIGMSAWKVGEFVTHLACSDEFKDVTGQFFFEQKIFRKPRKATDPVFAEELLKISRQLVQLSMNNNKSLV